MRVEGDWVARHDHDLVGQRVGKFIYDLFQYRESKSEDHGSGALQRVVVVVGNDRS